MILRLLFQTLFAFLMMFLVVRMLGKREVAHGTFWQLTSAFVLGSMAGNMALDGIHGIYAKAGAMVIWGGITYLIGYGTVKSRWFRGLMDSKPAVVIQNGKILEETLAAERLDLEGLLAALRQHQVTSLSDVEFAILEPSGKVSVIKKSQKQPVTPADLNLPTRYIGASTEVVQGGKIIQQNLQRIGLSEGWLQQELLLRGIDDLSEVVLASLDSEGRLYVDLKSDRLGRPPHPDGNLH